MRHLIWTLTALLLTTAANAQEAEEAQQKAPVDDAEASSEAPEPNPSGSDPDDPKAMSGMSILGNEEAPKSLVIIPWKSSEIGDDLGLDDSLNERAVPVDREVFLRELEFYEIRVSE